MVVRTREMAVEAVEWTGMNHEELISVFDHKPYKPARKHPFKRIK